MQCYARDGLSEKLNVLPLRGGRRGWRDSVGAAALYESPSGCESGGALSARIVAREILGAAGVTFAPFAAQPVVAKPDYAKWMLDDPRVNLAISTRGRQPGLDHLGIQVEDSNELQEVYGRLRTAGRNIIEQGQTTCCYAQSEKSWIDDPTGIACRGFLHHG